MIIVFNKNNKDSKSSSLTQRNSRTWWEVSQMEAAGWSALYWVLSLFSGFPDSETGFTPPLFYNAAGGAHVRVSHWSKHRRGPLMRWWPQAVIRIGAAFRIPRVSVRIAWWFLHRRPWKSSHFGWNRPWRTFKNIPAIINTQSNSQKFGQTYPFI